jgi:hypothetical protein
MGTRRSTLITNILVLVQDVSIFKIERYKKQAHGLKEYLCLAVKTCNLSNQIF